MNGCWFAELGAWTMLVDGQMWISSFCSRIYIVHDEVKDKAFELELSWVGESKWLLCTYLLSESSVPSLIYYKCHFFFNLKKELVIACTHRKVHKQQTAWIH